MNRAELAALLASADDEGGVRAALLGEHASLADASLAYALKDICLDAWSSEPALAVGAAEGLRALASIHPSEEIAALRSWAEGIASLVAGQMERAVAHLEDAESRFQRLCLPHTAASTQVSRLIALAMLGRYDEAVEAGLRAREQFLAHGDTAAAGKVENNIGNIYFRPDRFREAEQFYRAAPGQLSAAAERRPAPKLGNCLAK